MNDFLGRGNGRFLKPSPVWTPRTPIRPWRHAVPASARQPTKKLNIPIVVWTMQQQAAGFFYFFFKKFFYSFQCISKSQRIPEPISLLEGGRKYKEEKRSGRVRFKICTIVLLWGCDVIEGESAAGTDSSPTWKQSVFAHWSQHCQCYFIISFISAPIPNRFQRWTSVPLTRVDALCVTILAARVGVGHGKYISDSEPAKSDKRLQHASNWTRLYEKN